MFKRANKITALLVAAASIMSVVPVMAADTTRLGVKDGTITSAVAYADGKYLYEGYRSDDDDSGIYYNEGDSDKLLEDVEDSELVGNYADKYAYVDDSGDQYLVDLSSGDVLDDETPEDREDTAATKLKTAVKKTDRYGSTVSSDGTLAISADDLAQVPGGKYGEVWYQYAVTPENTADGINNEVVSTGKLYGFTNETGKYIDASNIANIYSYSTLKGKFVKIDEFSNTTDDMDDDTGLLATLAAAPEVLAQDEDYIYSKITVNIYDENAAAGDITGTTTSAAALVAWNTSDASKTVTRTYIQKISKAQGDKKDEAYVPKTVASYEVTKDELDCGDADDAYDAINDTDTSFTAVGGQLLAIKNTGENVAVTTINLKKDKVEYQVAVPTSFDGSKVDVYLAEKDDSDDVDIDASAAVDTDIDGVVWAVADGKIYKFENNEFTKVFTCDSSLDSLDVYDGSNLIAWEDDGDIYTTVNEGTAVTESEAGAVTTAPAAAVVGWSQLADGTWSFYDATGTAVASNWVNVGGVWYYLKADGIMATGWLSDGGTWYYLNASGAMKTGWLNDNGTWYYLNASGAMAANTTVDGYTLNASGAWVN